MSQVCGGGHRHLQRASDVVRRALPAPLLGELHARCGGVMGGGVGRRSHVCAFRQGIPPVWCRGVVRLHGGWGLGGGLDPYGEVNAGPDQRIWGVHIYVGFVTCPCSVASWCGMPSYRATSREGVGFFKRSQHLSAAIPHVLVRSITLLFRFLSSGCFVCVLKFLLCGRFSFFQPFHQEWTRHPLGMHCRGGVSSKT